MSGREIPGNEGGTTGALLVPPTSSETRGGDRERNAHFVFLAGKNAPLPSPSLYKPVITVVIW